ncbi:MAG TPA: hypothetical protein VMW03_07535 [Candidatus Krumholzibacteriaceae bacterium]|nr:hypothetical protein [Candidatus Krumholzibacteriaceae bacterium]
MVQSPNRASPSQAWAAAVAFSAVFTAVIWLTGPSLQNFLATLLPDQGASWYYWKLPVRDSTAMAVVWALYIGHQASVWAAIRWAEVNLRDWRKSPDTLNRYSLAVLGVNAVFMVLHLVQTHLWFDGLAQDVPIFTSQGSVIIMLAVTLILENRRRGFIMGRPLGRPFAPRVVTFFRRAHMYVFSWALVYTFWFHPMAYDPQLVSGFFYMFLLFTQMSLAFTGVHLRRWWIVLLESYVAIHAVIVAVYNTAFFDSAEMWPMFFTGFAFMFVFTYAYTFKLGGKANLLVTAAYAALLAWIFSPAPLGLGRSLTYLTRLEFIWIPVILYGLAIAFAAPLYLLMKDG